MNTNVSTGDLARVIPNPVQRALVDRIVTVGHQLVHGEVIGEGPFGADLVFDALPDDGVVWLCHLPEGAFIGAHCERTHANGRITTFSHPMTALPVSDRYLRRIGGVPVDPEELAAPGPGRQPVEQASGIGNIECTVEFPFVGVPA